MTQPELPYLYEIPSHKCDLSSGQRRLDALRDVVLPASHRDDPQSSKEAEEQANLGPRARNARQVLRQLLYYPDCTAAEMALCYADERANDNILSTVETRRRLHDLHVAGFVDRGETRKCRVADTSAVVWSLTERGREVAG